MAHGCGGESGMPVLLLINAALPLCRGGGPDVPSTTSVQPPSTAAVDGITTSSMNAALFLTSGEILNTWD